MHVTWLIVVSELVTITRGGPAGKKQNTMSVEVEPSGAVRAQPKAQSTDKNGGSDTVRLIASMVDDMEVAKDTKDTNECTCCVGGFYIDPNHHKDGTLAGTRMISNPVEGQIVLIGSDDGKEFWMVTGKSSDTCSFNIDFSPKGGPADAQSKYSEGHLVFGDENSWEKKTMRESLEATGSSNDAGGFYTDPNHFKESDKSWAGTRYVSEKEGVINIVGSDDGMDFYAVSGTKGVDSTEMVVDFSPKGGPKDISATFDVSNGEIHWGSGKDANVWSRVKAQ